MGYKIVCFNCRKAFNRPFTLDIDAISPKCPECGEPSIQLTHRFRPPGKADISKWSIVEYLHENGFKYEHIPNLEGNGYITYPETMREAKEFVTSFKGR